MVQALKYLHGDEEAFRVNEYAYSAVAPWENRIRSILEKRVLDASMEWKDLGMELSGCDIPDFDVDLYQQEYISASGSDRNETFLGQFILAAMAQKSMVTGAVFDSGNLLAGWAYDFRKKGFRGMKDFRMLAKMWKEDNSDD